jgi:hypothetical protein
MLCSSVLRLSCVLVVFVLCIIALYCVVVDVVLCCSFVDMSCVSCCFGQVLCFYCICVVLFVWDIQMVSCRIVVLVC